jgi:hypothetical protein
MQAEQRCSVAEDKKENEVQKVINVDATEQNINFGGFMIIRFTIVFLGLAAVCLNTIYGFALPHGNIECLLDKSFEATAGINKYLHDNVTARHVLIAVSSFCVDFVIVYMSFYWCFYAKSWRVVTALAVFYGFRGCVQVFLYIKFRMFFK